MSDELKPCPFCGSIPIIDINIYNSIRKDDYSVECDNIDCFVNHESTGATKEIAISRWNTRTESNETE